MGTPLFAVPSLRALIASQEIVGVVTQPDRPAGRGRQLKPSPVKLVAQEAGIPVYQPVSLRSAKSADQLRVWQPDVIVVAAFGQILRPHVLDLPPKGCINVHASLLPRWRGASPIQHAILSGDQETGITLMQMDVGLDTGPIYVQDSTPIAVDESSVSLHDRLAVMGAQLLDDRLDDILQGRLQARAQEEGLATYAPLINKEAGHIDWAESAVDIDRRIRAMTPWPGAYTVWEGKGLKILRAHLLPGRTAELMPGTVSEEADALVVHTGDGLIALDLLQLAGKKAAGAEAFLRGRPQFDGANLGA